MRPPRLLFTTGVLTTISRYVLSNVCFPIPVAQHVAIIKDGGLFCQGFLMYLSIRLPAMQHQLAELSASRRPMQYRHTHHFNSKSTSHLQCLSFRCEEQGTSQSYMSSTLNSIPVPNAHHRWVLIFNCTRHPHSSLLALTPPSSPPMLILPTLPFAKRSHTCSHIDINISHVTAGGVWEPCWNYCLKCSPDMLP